MRSTASTLWKSKHEISTRLNRQGLLIHFVKVNRRQNNRSKVLPKGNKKKMNLTVKTLKGGKFAVECEPSQTVLEVKAIIVSSVLNHALVNKAFRAESSGVCAFSRHWIVPWSVIQALNLSSFFLLSEILRNRRMPNFQRAIWNWFIPERSWPTTKPSKVSKRIGGIRFYSPVK